MGHPFVPLQKTEKNHLGPTQASTCYKGDWIKTAVPICIHPSICQSIKRNSKPRKDKHSCEDHSHKRSHSHSKWVVSSDSGRSWHNLGDIRGDMLVLAGGSLLGGDTGSHCSCKDSCFLSRPSICLHVFLLLITF